MVQSHFIILPPSGSKLRLPSIVTICPSFTLRFGPARAIGKQERVEFLKLQTGGGRVGHSSSVELLLVELPLGPQGGGIGVDGHSSSVELLLVELPPGSQVGGGRVGHSSSVELLLVD